MQFRVRNIVLGMSLLFLGSSVTAAQERLWIDSSCPYGFTTYVKASSAKRWTPLHIAPGGLDRVALVSRDTFDVRIVYPLNPYVYVEYGADDIDLKSLAGNIGPVVGTIELKFIGTRAWVGGRWAYRVTDAAPLELPITAGGGIVKIEVPLIAGATPPMPIPPRIK